LRGRKRGGELAICGGCMLLAGKEKKKGTSFGSKPWNQNWKLVGPFGGGKHIGTVFPGAKIQQCTRGGLITNDGQHRRSRNQHNSSLKKQKKKPFRDRNPEKRESKKGGGEVLGGKSYFAWGQKKKNGGSSRVWKRHTHRRRKKKRRKRKRPREKKTEHNGNSTGRHVSCQRTIGREENISRMGEMTLGSSQTREGERKRGGGKRAENPTGGNKDFKEKIQKGH